MDEAGLLADGWQRLTMVRYSAALGPVFKRIDRGKLEVCLLAQEHIGNDSFGIVHGGAMMTFADLALGIAVGHATGSSPFVTAQMQVQFVSAARTGQVIHCEPEVIRRTASLVFLRALFTSADAVVASADGIFKLIAPEKVRRLRAG